MKLTDEGFSAWCQRNHIPPATEMYLQRIRSSPPARRVRGRASNVSGRYPSVKMGVSIQFESQHVELWAIYAMERDDDVLEYYDQPTRIQLHYKSRSGRKTSPWHTPDFLVIRRNGAAFEEWKPAEALSSLRRVCLNGISARPAGDGVVPLARQRRRSGTHLSCANLQ